MIDIAADLLAIIAILLAILSSLTNFLYNRNKKINALYEIVWKKSSSLKQNKLLRGRPFFEYYYQRPQDDLLRQLLIEKKNILVIGSPGAGKTRAVYQALTNLNKPYDIIIPNCVDIDIESFLLPKHIMFWRPKLIIIDDLHRFVDNKNFNHLFKISIESNIIVIATCRSGIEYKKVKRIMLDNNIAIKTIFDDNIIEYDKITKEIGNEIANKVGIDWNKVKFTGTFGSIFMYLDEMERRFDRCTYEEKTILRDIKKLYISGIYKKKYIFPLNWIKIVNKKTGLILKKFEYEKWIGNLEEKEFIKFQEDMVWIDEIYLENIVILKKPDLSIFEEMISTFSEIPEILFKVGNHAYEVGVNELEKAEYMKIAIHAYKEMLKVKTLDRLPMDYAMTQNNLGNAYIRLAEVESKAVNCQKAIQTYEEALKVTTLAHLPMDYAMTQNNLGNAYRTLAEVESKAENCQKAIQAYEEALKVRTLDRLPMD